MKPSYVMALQARLSSLNLCLNVKERHWGGLGRGVHDLVYVLKVSMAL